MINRLSFNPYDAIKKPYLFWPAIFGFIFIGLSLSNKVMEMAILSTGNYWPWSFKEAIQYGYLAPLISALLMALTPIFSIFLWVTGGIYRGIGCYLLSAWALILFCTWLAVYLFIVWDGVDVTPYPWLVFNFLRVFKAYPLEYEKLIMCLFGSYSLIPICIVYKLFSAKTKAEKIFGHAHFANVFELHRSKLFSDKGLVLGKAFGKCLRLQGYESALVVAPTGSGKTTAIAIPNLLEWDGSGVFNDLKGELYKLTAKYREKQLRNQCYCWSPASPDMKGHGYNPFYYVSDNPNLRIRDIQLIAETLIPASRLGDSFWYQSSREIFLTLVLYLYETKQEVTLGNIHDLSKQECFFDWLEEEVEENKEEFSKQLKQNAYSIISTDERTRSNILKDFHSRMALFSDPIINAATSRNDFDFRQLRKKKMSIYINIPDADKERLSPILTLFWAQLVNILSEKEPQADEPYGVLALMDEFGNMSKINKLKDGLSFLRSYKLRCLIIVQYLSQITVVYGRDEAKGFLNAKVKVAFALNDIDDANFFSKALGTKTVRVSSSSISSGHGDHAGSRSENVNFQSRALMTPDEIMQLKSDKAIILMESKNPILAEKCYWFRELNYKYLLN